MSRSPFAPQTPPARPRYFLPATVLILLVGFGLRVWHVTETSLWIDELWTTFYIESPVGKFFKLLMQDGTQVPLYYMIMYLFPTDNDLLLRLPMLLSGLVGIPLLMWLVLRLYSDYWLALAAGVLLASNPYHISFSRTAHPYALAFVEVLLVSYYFLQLLQGIRSRKIWLGFVLSSMAAYVTHLFTLVLPLTQYIILGFTLRYNRWLFRRWQKAQIIASIPLAFWTCIRLIEVRVGIGTAWIPEPRLADIPLTLANMGVGYDGTTAWYFFIPALIVLVIGLGAGLIYAVRKSRPKGADFFWAWLIALTILPTFAVSSIHPAYVDRYFIVCLPAIILLMLRGWTILSRSNWQRMTLAGIVAVTGAGYAVRMIYTNDWEHQDWEDAALYVRDHFQPGDGFSNDIPLWLICLEHYYDQGVTPRDQAYPVLAQDAPPPPIDRLWVIYLNPVADIHRQGKMPEFDPYTPGLTAIGDWLIAHRDRVIDLREFNGVTVLLVDMR